MPVIDLEQLAGEMAGAAVAAGAERQLARIAPSRSAISSFTELTGNAGLTTSTFGVIATSVIGAKSFTASYGILA